MSLRNVSIRKFRPEDAKAVSDIIKDNLLNLNSKDPTEEIINPIHQQFTPRFLLSMSNKRKMYVALHDDMIVGTASIDHDTIYTVFVALQYHGKGIDKALVSLLEEIAANNGLRLVKLVAGVTAQKLFEKLGYSAADVQESEEFGKEVVMEKYLV